jgi:hypothetical protein
MNVSKTCIFSKKAAFYWSGFLDLSLISNQFCRKSAARQPEKHRTITQKNAPGSSEESQKQHFF